MNKFEDFLSKTEKVRKLLAHKNYEAIELKLQANFSWLTRGRGFIGLASVLACGSLFVTPSEVFLISENIEAERLYKEQLNSNPYIRIKSYPWDDSSKRDDIMNSLYSKYRVASETELSNDLLHLRSLLTHEDLYDYKTLCKENALIIERICKNLTVGITEYELAGLIASKMWRANIEPITILIAFDERATEHRHPVMVGKSLANYALVAVCGRRNGLIASLTRDVLINPDDEMILKHDKCAIVNAAFYSNLKPGNLLGEVYSKGIIAYEEQGYPLEYKEHHQGGLTGFVPREIRANSGNKHLIRTNEAYAFNPTIQGAKCEDTVLVRKDGIDIMTFTGKYAYKECRVNGHTYNIPTVYIIN